jgi:hypothetical protein
VPRPCHDSGVLQRLATLFAKPQCSRMHHGALHIFDKTFAPSCPHLLEALCDCSNTLLAGGEADCR